LTVWPATPFDDDSVIADVVTLKVADVDDVSFATSVVGPAGILIILNVPVITPPAAALPDVTFVGVVTRAVPSLIVKLNVLLGVKLVPDNVTVVPLGPDAGDSVIAEATVNDVVALLEPSVALTGNVPRSVSDGTLNVTPEKPPVELVLAAAGVVVTDLEPKLNVTLLVADGRKLFPDTVIVWPTLPVDDDSVIVGTVPIVNGAIGALLPSDALMLLSALAVDGTTNVAVNPPVELAVIAAGVVTSAVLFSVSLTVLVGTKLSPVTLTV
jgi:hypothetical protein